MESAPGEAETVASKLDRIRERALADERKDTAKKALAAHNMGKNACCPWGFGNVYGGIPLCRRSSEQPT
jgi:hypothetical protein